MQSISERVGRNKLVLHISKTKSIVFGTNHSLNHKPQLNIAMNNVEIELVEEIKLLGVTLESKLLWSKHIDAAVARIGRRRLYTIKQCSALTTRQVLHALVLSHLDYCSVVWSGATKMEFGNLHLGLNRAPRLALGGTRRALSVIHN